ncbi:MAG: hypothetical protein KAR45_13465 [Desulfobacteraceae bacterium]|nr:hypothetical protein [Desulfobacteraceae bacterium]
MKLESELNTLSKKAESLIKPPKLNIASILLQKKSSNFSTSSFTRAIAGLFSNLYSKPAILFAIIALCVLSILYLPGPHQNNNQSHLTTGPLTEAFLIEIDRDLKFAETIDQLEDYALSGFITSSDNQNYNLDEFIEFITPTTEETIL